MVAHAAAHVLNLSRPTSFDFGGVAKRVAEALMTQRKVDIHDGVGTKIGQFGTGRLDGDKPVDFGFAVDVSELEIRRIGPEALTKDEMDKVFQALRLGGLDFAEQLLTECRRLITDAADPNLRPPIDPSNLQEGESE